jgi:hypothetical protein
MTSSHIRVGDLPLRNKLIMGVAAMLMLACIALAGASKADAFGGYFCNGYNAAPYGQPGDRCGAPSGNFSLTGVSGSGSDHSACVNAMDQNGALWGSWVCSGGPNQNAYGTWGNEFRSARGIVRNNSTGGTNHLYGAQG